MDNQILDQLEVKNENKNFSKFSFISSIITLILVGYSLANTPFKIKASETIQEPNMIAITAIQFFCVIGMIMMILSFVKREPSNWFKWIGGIINILLFLLLVGSIIFARVMDSMN